MRILFCTLDYPPSAAGGAEQQARLQAEELVRRGHKVDVVCARAPGHRSEERHGVSVHRLHRVELRYLRTITYLVMLALFMARMVRRYDLVHVHLANLQADVAVAVARIGRRPSYLKVAAGGPLGEVGRMRLVAPVTRYFGLRHADLVQAISEEVAHDVRSLGVPAERIRRVPNGVMVRDSVPTSSERDAARARLAIQPSASVVLYAGRMEREKGVADLVRAWGLVNAKDAKLLLVGSPGRKDPVPLTGLPRGVEHRPWTSRVEEYLLAADVVVLPSYVEGMSNVLLEAMSMGIACIATRVGAAPEMMQEGEAGLLVDPGDGPAIVEALRTVIADADLRGRIGARARNVVSQRYSIASVVDAIEAGYRSLVPPA